MSLVSMATAVLFFAGCSSTGTAPAIPAAKKEAASESIQAGIARVCITPPLPFRLSGFAARKGPADGVLMDLWAKALAMKDGQGNQIVIVTTDLIGFSGRIADEIGKRAKAAYGLGNDQLILSCSHTHSGPVLRENLTLMYALKDEEDRRVRDYSEILVQKVTSVIGEAIKAQKPALLSFAQGKVGFAINRRVRTPSGFKISVNPDGPVDHSVPVVRVSSPDGVVRAVLFGYSCHNTTLGATMLKVNGDYAGFAQAEIERAYPGVTAMFMILCGADQNPNPRGTVELAQKYGRALADEVGRVISSDMRPLHAPLRAARESVTLPFAPHTREAFVAETKDADIYRQRRAKQMLEDYDKGAPIRSVQVPVQAFAFGSDLTLLAIGGEVVVDYALRAKKEFGADRIVTAGYCNEVMGYIPSERVLKEGGYEGGDSMIYYGMPGPFASGIEETLFAGIYRTLSRVGVNRPRRRPRRGLFQNRCLVR